jgi:hypothetical protein
MLFILPPGRRPVYRAALREAALTIPALVSGGVMLYRPHIYDLLARLPGEGTHTLEEFCTAAGLGPDDPRVLQLCDVIPSVRAAQALRRFFTASPAAAFYRG